MGMQIRICVLGQIKPIKNGKWLHDELSIWRNHKGAFHRSMLEDSWRGKIHNSDEKFTDEWGNKIEGKKYGYIEMKDLLFDEYTSYKELKKKEVIQLLKKEIKNNPPKKVEELFEDNDEEVTNEDDNNSIKCLKSEYELILNDKNITYDDYDNIFYDKNQPIIKKLINLSPEKYLRPYKINKVKFEEFKKQNEVIFNKINTELIDLTK